MSPTGIEFPMVGSFGLTADVSMVIVGALCLRVGPGESLFCVVLLSFISAIGARFKGLVGNAGAVCGGCARQMDARRRMS
jgi:hypothetical protein